MTTIILNGSVTPVPPCSSVASLVASLGLRAGSVVVEHNGTALLRGEHDGVTLAEGDRVEVVRAVAGG